MCVHLISVVWEGSWQYVLITQGYCFHHYVLWPCPSWLPVTWQPLFCWYLFLGPATCVTQGLSSTPLMLPPGKGFTWFFSPPDHSRGVRPQSSSWKPSCYMMAKWQLTRNVSSWPWPYVPVLEQQSPFLASSHLDKKFLKLSWQRLVCVFWGKSIDYFL
jgi:hypothetical protein